MTFITHIPTYRCICGFLKTTEPVKLTGQALVNRAFQTSGCLSFPFCSMLNRWKELHLVICQSLYPRVRFLLGVFFFPLWNLCVRLLPFRLGSGCPRWRLACTCHATCAVAAAQSRKAASAPRTAAPRLHRIHNVHDSLTLLRRDARKRDLKRSQSRDGC